MDDQVLLFHGLGSCSTCGGIDMAGYYDPYTGMYVKKRTRRRKRVSGIEGFGQALSVRDTMAGIKQVVYTGAIAGAGAVVTDKVWDMIGKDMSLSYEVTALAKMATGIALGLVVAKLLKRPQLGIALAIGPIAVGVKDLVNKFMGTTVTVTGVPEIVPQGFQRAITKAPFQGVQGIPQVGTQIPDWMNLQTEPQWSFAT